MAFERVVKRAHEVLFVQQRKQPRRFVYRNDFHVEAQVAGTGAREFQEVHPLRCARKGDPGSDVDAARLA